MGTSRFFLIGEEMGVHLGQGDQGGEEMESPLRLGLGTIYVVPLCGRTDLTTIVWVRSLGTILGRC